MPPDEHADEVVAWLTRARQDLRAAHVGLGAEPPLSADAAFHGQQAVEKALKAFLTHHDHPFRKTHDIGELAQTSLEHEPSLEDVLRRSVGLTEYAWRFRYPGEPFEPEVDEVHDAIRRATEVVEAVAALIEARRDPSASV